jgi:hypothetical protein
MATSEITRAGRPEGNVTSSSERSYERSGPRRHTRIAEDVGALAAGAVGGVVIGIGLVFLIAWLVA